MWQEKISGTSSLLFYFILFNFIIGPLLLVHWSKTKSLRGQIQAPSSDYGATPTQSCAEFTFTLTSAAP